jgi:hypothetical protein
MIIQRPSIVGAMGYPKEIVCAVLYFWATLFEIGFTAPGHTEEPGQHAKNSPQVLPHEVSDSRQEPSRRSANPYGGLYEFIGTKIFGDWVTYRDSQQD